MARGDVACTRPELLFSLMTLLLSAPAVMDAAQGEERNKALARRFYEQVWFSRNVGAVDELVASEYVVHDIGDRKAVVEPAGAQKQLADFFWQHGTMTGRIDFQVAEGDLVATRWQWQYQPRTWWMKASMLGAQPSVPIINVFRFEDGKIVEIWNHRHDIDTGYASNRLVLQGFAAGLLVATLTMIGIRTGPALFRRASGGHRRAPGL